MLFGLSGASRSGKTTLGKAVAQDLGIHFVSNSTPQVTSAAGYNVINHMNLDDRLLAQHVILEQHIKLINEAPRPLIIDRTPLDFAAYLLAEFDMQALNRAKPETIDGVERYVEECLTAVRTYYDSIFYVAAHGGAYKHEEGKHAPNPAFILHHSTLIRGLMFSTGILTGSIGEPDLNKRREQLNPVIVDRMNDIAQHRHSGVSIH